MRRYASPSGDIATPGVTVLRTSIASLEQELQAREERLKARELDCRSQLFAADGRVQTASTSTEASLKRQSALEQGVAFLRDQLSAAIPTQSVDVKSGLASFCKELAAANDMIGKLRAEMKTGADQMDYSWRRAGDQFSELTMSG